MITRKEWIDRRRKQGWRIYGCSEHPNYQVPEYLVAEVWMHFYDTPHNNAAVMVPIMRSNHGNNSKSASST